MAAEEAEEAKSRRVVWVGLTIFLLAGVTTALLSPTGQWRMLVWDLPYGAFSDPDGPYLTFGLELSPLRTYPGHPGLPLRLITHAIALSGFALTGVTGSQVAYETFVLDHFVGLAAGTRIAITLGHLVCVVLVGQLTRRLFGSRHAAMLAMVGYALSWPVLRYLTKISPEPIFVALALGSMLSLVSWAQLEDRGEHGRALAWIAVAGLCSAVGILTKLMIMLPFSLAIVTLIALGGWPLRRLGFESVQRSVSALGIHLLVATAVLLASTWMMDWSDFFAFWFHYSGSGASGSGAEFVATKGLVENLAAGLPGFIAGLATKLTSGLLDGPAALAREVHSRLICLPLLIGAGVGFVMAWRERAADRRGLLLIGLLVLAATPIPLFRNQIHYWILHAALGAPFAGWAVFRLAEWMALRLAGGSIVTLGLCVLLLLQAPTIASFISLNRHNAEASQRARPCLAAITTPPRNRSILVRGSELDLLKLHGLVIPFLVQDSKLLAAYRERFRVVDEHSEEASAPGAHSFEIVLREDGRRVCDVVGDGRPAIALAEG